MTITQIIGQGVVLAVFAAALGYGSQRPIYAPVDPDRAVIRIALAHGGKRLDGCRDRNAEELAKLAPNMRKKRVCDRARAPIRIEVKIDGATHVQETLGPGGIAGDGPARYHRVIEVASGEHVIEAALADSGRESGFDYHVRKAVALSAGQSLAINFRPLGDGFVFE
jgi:hypothetical protein